MNDILCDPDPPSEAFVAEWDTDVKTPLAAVIGRAVGVFFEQMRKLREFRATRLTETECLRELDATLRTWAYPAERYAFAVCAVWGLPRAEMCMVLDDLIQTLEPLRPTPGWGDTMAEAHAWAQNVPQSVLRAYIFAAWSEYEGKRQRDFIKEWWKGADVRERRAFRAWTEEAEKAEALSG